MDKVILYGGGGQFHTFLNTFRNFVKKKKLYIIGVADKKIKENVFMEFQVIKLDEISRYNPDRVIITASDAAYNSIYSDLVEIGVNREIICNVYDYPLIVEKLNEVDSQQLPIQLNLIKKLLNATDEEVTSFEWMRNLVGQYGIYPFMPGDMDGINNMVGTRVGILQRPNEFAEYCVYLSTKKIETAIEVGVYHGKSSYFMCAVLARRNPNLSYELVDIVDNLDNYDDFHSLLPWMKKRIPSTSNDYIGKKYDFVFIDADHSYDASIKDYYNLGQYANKLTVFHDIYAHEYDALNGGTVRMWQEVVNMTPQLKHYVFSEYPNQWMGIGVLDRMISDGDL